MPQTGPSVLLAGITLVDASEVAQISHGVFESCYQLSEGAPIGLQGVFVQVMWHPER